MGYFSHLQIPSNQEHQRDNNKPYKTKIFKNGEDRHRLEMTNLKLLG